MESEAAHLAQAAIPSVVHHGPVTMESTPEAKVRLFQDLFRARSDIYAVRWENSRDGRSGWVPAVVGGWRKGANIAGANFLPLTPFVVADHLRGVQHIGLYPLTEQDTCWWVAADFDGGAAMLDALAYVRLLAFGEFLQRWKCPSPDVAPMCGSSSVPPYRRPQHASLALV